VFDYRKAGLLEEPDYLRQKFELSSVDFIAEKNTMTRSTGSAAMAAWKQSGQSNLYKDEYDKISAKYNKLHVREQSKMVAKSVAAMDAQFKAAQAANKSAQRGSHLQPMPRVSLEAALAHHKSKDAFVMPTKKKIEQEALAAVQKKFEEFGAKSRTTQQVVKDIERQMRGTTVRMVTAVGTWAQSDQSPQIIIHGTSGKITATIEALPLSGGTIKRTYKQSNGASIGNVKYVELLHDKAVQNPWKIHSLEVQVGHGNHWVPLLPGGTDEHEFWLDGTGGKAGQFGGLQHKDDWVLEPKAAKPKPVVVKADTEKPKPKPKPGDVGAFQGLLQIVQAMGIKSEKPPALLFSLTMKEIRDKIQGGFPAGFVTNFEQAMFAGDNVFVVTNKGKPMVEISSQVLGLADRATLPGLDTLAIPASDFNEELYRVQAGEVQQSQSTKNEIAAVKAQHAASALARGATAPATLLEMVTSRPTRSANDEHQICQNLFATSKECFKKNTDEKEIKLKAEKAARESHSKEAAWKEKRNKETVAKLMVEQGQKEVRRKVAAENSQKEVNVKNEQDTKEVNQKNADTARQNADESNEKASDNERNAKASDQYSYENYKPPLGCPVPSEPGGRCGFKISGAPVCSNSANPKCSTGSWCQPASYNGAVMNEHWLAYDYFPAGCPIYRQANSDLKTVMSLLQGSNLTLASDANH